MSQRHTFMVMETKSVAAAYFGAARDFQSCLTKKSVIFSQKHWVNNFH